MALDPDAPIPFRPADPRLPPPPPGYAAEDVLVDVHAYRVRMRLGGEVRLLDPLDAFVLADLLETAAMRLRRLVRGTATEGGGLTWD